MNLTSLRQHHLQYTTTNILSTFVALSLSSTYVGTDFLGDTREKVHYLHSRMGGRGFKEIMALLQSVSILLLSALPAAFSPQVLQSH